MAGFETIVRPVVNPNIRPSPAQRIAGSAAATPNDPERGFAVINGNPAKSYTETTTISQSISRNHGAEYQRRVDRVRVFQKLDDGTINRDNFIDVDVTNRLRKRDGFGKTTTWYRRAEALGLQPGEAGSTNIELIAKDIIFNTKMGGDLGSG